MLIRDQLILDWVTLHDRIYSWFSLSPQTCRHSWEKTILDNWSIIDAHLYPHAIVRINNLSSLLSPTYPRARNFPQGTPQLHQSFRDSEWPMAGFCSGNGSMFWYGVGSVWCCLLLNVLRLALPSYVLSDHYIYNDRAGYSLDSGGPQVLQFSP